MPSSKRRGKSSMSTAQLSQAAKMVLARQQQPPNSSGAGEEMGVNSDQAAANPRLQPVAPQLRQNLPRDAALPGVAQPLSPAPAPALE